MIRFELERTHESEMDSLTSLLPPSTIRLLHMKEESSRLIREVIAEWQARKEFTYHHKEFRGTAKNPMMPGEYLLHFAASIRGFYCNGTEIPVAVSTTFRTMTLSENPLSDNPRSDKYRLEKQLEELNNRLEVEFNDKVTQCVDIIFTTDPLFF